MRRFSIFFLLSLLLHALFSLWGGTALGDHPQSSANPPVIMVTYTPMVSPVTRTAPAPHKAQPIKSSGADTDQPSPLEARAPEEPAPSIDKVDSVLPAVADEKSHSSPMHIAPESALLKLEVSLRYHGFGPNLAGELAWQRSADGYQLRLETLLEPEMRRDLKILRKSQGQLLPEGLAPVRYTEQRGKKAEVATNFQYAATATPESAPYISFSRVTDRFPLAPGSQDELSVLMQVSVLLRAHPDWLSQPGSTFEIPVAGTRDVQKYQFTFIGEELVSSRLGTQPCWHVRSQPLADRYATQIEVWLASKEGFLPIKIRLSSGDGISIETLAQEIVRP